MLSPGLVWLKETCSACFVHLAVCKCTGEVKIAPIMNNKRTFIHHPTLFQICTETVLAVYIICRWRECPISVLSITVRTECVLHGPGRPDICPVSGLTSLPLCSIHGPSAQGLSPGCILHLERAIAFSLSAHPSFLSLNITSSEKPSWIHTWPWGLTLRYLCPSGT